VSNEAITATVVDEIKVEYNCNQYSLSALAAKLLKDHCGWK